MPKKRNLPFGLGKRPVDWVELWGSPSFVEQGEEENEGETCQRPKENTSKRAKIFEYDSDSENEDLAKQLVAKHYDETQAQNSLDCAKVLECYTVEEVVALRAEMRQQSEGPSDEEDCVSPRHLDDLRDATKYEQEMGHHIEPFHMQEERRMGRFDQDGFWIQDKPDDATDPWLKSLDEQRAITSRKPPGKPEISAKPTVTDKSFRPVDGYMELFHILCPGETVGAALWRLKKEAQGSGLSKANKSPCSEELQHLVSLADQLVLCGDYHLWDASYEQLQTFASAAQLKEAAAASARQREEKGAMQWELVWSLDIGAEIHGPFTAEVMDAWQRESYFSTGGVAYARPVTTDMFALEEAEWIEAQTIDFFK